MSGIGKIAFEHLKYNHANNHDNIVTIFFRYSENQKNSRQKSLLRTKVITFLIYMYHRQMSIKNVVVPIGMDWNNNYPCKHYVPCLAI